MNVRPYRILVTGSRDWTREDIVHAALSTACYQKVPAIIVHGACPTGADAQASWWTREHAVIGLVEEQHHAAWVLHGRGAGPIRNRTMVDAGADVCLAFIRNGSRGATGCAALAEAAGIPVRRWEEP
ncbi:SLOG family protein [Streptomyces sp. NPDC090054]|uniref:SLOG family protein n=1 Tax=Streptomyces sp. NPDC090054 TaxID=3365933 RepID=UPI00382B9437